MRIAYTLIRTAVKCTKLIPVVLFMISSSVLHAQKNVAIDKENPDPSAILDLDDDGNQRGLLVPSMSSTERQAIATPADGLLVYDTDQKMFYHYDAGMSNWQAVNPYSYRKGSDATDEDHFVIKFTDALVTKSFVIGNVPSPTARLEVDGDAKSGGNLISGGDLSATTISTTGNIKTDGVFAGYGTIPLGGIIMWSGTTVPAGWALCDGQTTAEGYTTPNLTGRFIVGYDDATSPNAYTQPGNLSTKGTTVGNTGGAESVTLVNNQLPIHNHPNSTTSDDGAHSHEVGRRNFLYDVTGTGKERADAADGSGSGISTKSAGSHMHAISVQNTGGGQPHENRPPYYVLAYIMRVQ